MESENFFGLGRLTDLGMRSAIDLRPTLLRVLTDLYVHRLSHTADEERHYTELAVRMLEVVDVPTRVAVAKRFARYLSPPLRVLQWLARDVPEVAAELRMHPPLQPPVPASATLPDQMAIPIAADAVPAEPDSVADLSQDIDTDTAHELNDLFLAANATERRLILLNFNVVAPGPALRVPIAGDQTVSERLETAALAGKREDFAHQLAGVLKIPREQARRIADDALGEPIIVAAKALGLRRDVLYRILMFINPSVGHSVERVHALAMLYDELAATAAQGMVAIWQALQQQEQAGAKHRPFAWDDEARRHARPGAAAQSAPAPRRTSERRNAS